MDGVSRRRVRFTAPGEVEVVTEEAPSLGPREVGVKTKYSAISPGTERLIYQGNIPEDLDADSSISALKGKKLSYPISYGYACVGKVDAVGEEVDQEWHGTHVFAFQPHVSRFVSTPDALIRLPGEVDLEDAVLIPSVETALNLVMDGRPMIGEHVLVFGQGVVGLLTVCLLERHPLGALISVEPLASRRTFSESMGADAIPTVSALDQIETFGKTSTDGSTSESKRADLVYELTGQPSVLNDAIHCTGFDGRIVIGSWYGTKTAEIDLGRRFHRSRMEIISSQVSTIDPSYRGRWTKSRRMSVVLELLNDVTPRRLITHRFEIGQASSTYEKLTEDPSVLQPVFVYD